MSWFYSFFGKWVLVPSTLIVFAFILLLANSATALADPPIGPIAYLPQSNGFNTIAYDTHAHSYAGSTPMAAGNYYGVAVNPAGTYAYVTNGYGNDLVVIDTATNQQVADILLPAPGYEFLGGCRPGAVIVSSDNLHVYVACNTGQRVYEIDAQTNTITKDIGIGAPIGLALSADGLELYVGSAYNYTLRIVNLADPNFSQRILQVRAPAELVSDPGTNLIYLSHLPYDDITIINPASSITYPNGRIVGVITIDQIRDMEFSPDGSTLYLTRQPYDTPHGEIVSFDTAQVEAAPQNPITYNVTDAIQVPLSPTVANLDSSGGCMFVQRPEAFGMLEIDMHTRQIAREYFVGYGLGTPGRFLMPTPASQWVEFKDTAYDVNDDGGTAQLNVRRGCNSTGQVTVHYETADDSAQAGVDYQAASGDLTFADGELVKTITVNILDDHLYHGDARFNVVLSNPDGATFGDPSSADVTIHETTPNADLRLNVNSNHYQADTGDQVTYCFNVVNSGPTAADNTTLTAEIPAGATFSSYQFTDCGGGGESRVLPLGRIGGNAFPMANPTCVTPAAGQAGTITCAIGSLERGTAASLEIVLNITAAYGTVTFGAQVSSDIFDPYADNNARSRVLSIRSDVYVAADGNCSGQPCYEQLQEGMDHTQNGKMLHISGGTYAGGLSVNNNGTVELMGNVTIGGSLQVYSGNLVSTPNTLILKGDLYTNANFDANNGTVVMGAEGSQTVNSNVTFHNLTIQQGATVEASYYQITVNGTFINNGVLRGYSYNYFDPQQPLVFNDPLSHLGVQLTSTGENLPDSAVVTIGNGEPPASCGDDPFPATPVQRSYEITPYSSNPIELTVRFYFDTAEADGLVLNTLQVYHCNGTAWEMLGGTYGVDESGRKYVEISGVDSFSPFGLGGNAPAAPTSATLVSVKAKPHKKGGVQFKWETGSEVNVLGFNLWRSNKQKGEFEKINPAPKPAKNTGEIQGNKYSLRDKKAKANKTYFYKLEVVRVDGTSEWSEPLKVKVP